MGITQSSHSPTDSTLESYNLRRLNIFFRTEKTGVFYHDICSHSFKQGNSVNFQEDGINRLLKAAYSAGVILDSDGYNRIHIDVMRGYSFPGISPEAVEAAVRNFKKERSESGEWMSGIKKIRFIVASDQTIDPAYYECLMDCLKESVPLLLNPDREAIQVDVQLQLQLVVDD